MAVEIGSKGLLEANITLPQSSSLTFTVIHEDEEGVIVDHSGDTASMAFQAKDKSLFVDLDSCVTCAENGIYITIPANVSEDLPLGKMNWDLFITTSAEQIRLCYGVANIVDTYAMDE